MPGDTLASVVVRLLQKDILKLEAQLQIHECSFEPFYGYPNLAPSVEMGLLDMKFFEKIGDFGQPAAPTCIQVADRQASAGPVDSMIPVLNGKTEGVWNSFRAFEIEAHAFLGSDGFQFYPGELHRLISAAIQRHFEIEDFMLKTEMGLQHHHHHRESVLSSSPGPLPMADTTRAIQSRSSSGHICTICTKPGSVVGFSRASTLTRHLRTVHNERDWEWLCPFCRQTFSRKDNFRDHLRGQHWNEIHLLDDAGLEEFIDAAIVLVARST